MNARKWLAALLVVVLIAAGAAWMHQRLLTRHVPIATRLPPSTQPAPTLLGTPTTHPSLLAGGPASAPSLTYAPTPALLILGQYPQQQMVSFPPALLSYSTVNGKLQARLYTDDPPAALEADYNGNSFDLEMPLNVSTASDVSHAVWRLQKFTDQPDESPLGIFIHGQQQRLHPENVLCQFFPRKDGRVVVLLLQGQFQLLDQSRIDQGYTQPQHIMVQGRIVAQVVAR